MPEIFSNSARSTLRWIGSFTHPSRRLPQDQAGRQPVFYRDAAPLPRVPRAQMARQRPIRDRTPGTAVGRGSRQAGRTFPLNTASPFGAWQWGQDSGYAFFAMVFGTSGGPRNYRRDRQFGMRKIPSGLMVAPTGATIFTLGSLTRLFRTNWSRLDCGRPPRGCSRPVPPACATCRCSCACGSRRPCRTRRPDSGAPSRSSRSSAQPSVPA